MKKFVYYLFSLMIFLGWASFGNAAPAPKKSPASQPTPEWVQDLGKAYPSANWVAVNAQGTSQREAESAAMNALARAFKTDIASLTEANQHFSQIVNDAAGKKSVSFNESKDFSTQVQTGSNVRALIGVETGTFQSSDGSTWYVNARMNRRECSARYAGMVRENVAVIDDLLSRASSLESRSLLEAAAALYFASSIAQVTDNFQNILEVLDSSAANRRPGYGGAAAIKTRMQGVMSRITIGLRLETMELDRQEISTIRRAFGAFFTGIGFKINEQGTGNYVLNGNVSFEVVATTQTKTCRWFLDTALEDSNGGALFTYTGQNRAVHMLDTEARRLALRAVESSIKGGDFAKGFDTWFGSLLD
jgi:hypothetical protein